jgi:hypothetical protein
MKVQIGTMEISDWERELLASELGRKGKATRLEVRDRVEYILRQYFDRLGAAAQVHGKNSKAFLSAMDKVYGLGSHQRKHR